MARTIERIMQGGVRLVAGVVALGLVRVPLGAQGRASGVPVVANTRATLWAGTAGWRLRPEREFRVPIGSPGELGRPFTPALSPDGTLYVLDRNPVGIKVYGKDGKYLRTIGRGGAGPGEFAARAIIALHGDTLVVLDRSTHRILFFSAEGKSISETLLKDIEPDNVLGSEGNGPIPVLGRSGANQIIVMWVNTKGVEVSRAMIPGDGLSRNFPGCALGIPYSPTPSVVPERGGTVIWGNQDALRFVRSRTGKDASLVFSATGSPPKVTAADVDRLFGPKGSMKQLCPTAQASELPTIKPFWQRMYTDGSGNIWVLMTSNPTPTFLVFSPAGALLGTVDDPMDRNNNSWWFGDQTVEFVPDDDGGMLIRIWRIDRQLGR